MLKQERIQLMEDYIAQKGFASMDELCQTFSVSINTVRADIREIISRGCAQKTYGGVTYATQPAQYRYETREKENTVKKREIAKIAAQMVSDGDIIYIDLGTTCLPMLDFIPEEHVITVITNDLSIINKAAKRQNVRILTFGGTYQQKSNSFKCTFPAMHSYIDTCNISKAFLGTTGVSATGLMTNSENFGREVRSQLIKTCPNCYLLADSSKFGKAALLTYGALTDLTACISDGDLPQKYRDLCREQGVRLLLADIPK